MRFRVGVRQTYSLRRELDEKTVQRFRNYASDYPDDAVFALQAAGEILGDDFGGNGPAGQQRRRLACELLEPVLNDADAGTVVLFTVGIIEMKEGRYRRADSLMTLAYERAPNEPYVLYSLALLKGELFQPSAGLRASPSS